jgi:hypothetical protein
MLGHKSFVADGAAAGAQGKSALKFLVALFTLPSNFNVPSFAPVFQDNELLVRESLMRRRQFHSNRRV